MCTRTQIDFLQSFLFPNDLPLDAAFVREYGVSGPGGRRVLGCYSTTGRLLADAFCEAKTNEPKQRRFTDTLVTGAYDLCALVKSLPALKDHSLVQVASALEDALGGASAQALREDHTRRDEVKSKVDSLLSKLDFSL